MGTRGKNGVAEGIAEPPDGDLAASQEGVTEPLASPSQKHVIYAGMDGWMDGQLWKTWLK